MKKDSLIYTIIFTAISAFVFVFLLSLANSATKEQVEKGNRILEAKAYLAAAGIALSESDNPLEMFDKAYPDFNSDNFIQETVINGRKILVAPFQGSGLWGTITGVMGMTSDFERIVGFEILSHSETPGLGGRIDETWFKDQFKGESVANGIIVNANGSGDSDSNNGQVDGITGATRTSDSIETIVNQQIETMKSAKGGNN